jgi:CHASE3 domain sensor protein
VTEWAKCYDVLREAHEGIDNVGGYLLDREDEAAERLAALLPTLDEVMALLQERVTEQEEMTAEYEAERVAEYEASLVVDPEDDPDHDPDEDPEGDE